MDQPHSIPTGLEEMLAASNTRATYHNQLRIAASKFRGSCMLGFSGGRFLATPELIGFLHHKLTIDADRAIVLDANGLPILIDSLQAFMDIISSTYHEALNEYYDECVRLRKSRSPTLMVEATE